MGMLRSTFKVSVVINRYRCLKRRFQILLLINNGIPIQKTGKLRIKMRWSIAYLIFLQLLLVENGVNYEPTLHFCIAG
jgi:hypothetical protein